MYGPYTILIVLFITMVLFIWGYWRYDIVAIIALMISVLIGAVPFSHVYIGFSNPAVITVACVMIISQAITRSGAISFLVNKITYISKNPVLHIGSLTLISAVLSAFMNNVGALALMMPVAIQTAIKGKRSPSLVLMPIALGSAMGGLTTLIGTPPNLLISFFRQETVGQPFSMFDYSHVGFFVAVVGVLFIAFVGWRLLPKRKSFKQAEDMFQLQDYLAEIKVPKKSPVEGKTIRELEKLTKGDITITGIIRKNKKKFIIPPTYVLKAEDILIIESSPENLQELLQAGKLEIVGSEKAASDILRSDDIALIEAVVPPGSRIENRSSQSIRLRARYRINLLALAREGSSLKKRLHEVTLRAGDVVLLQGPADILQENVTTLGFLPLVERKLDVGMKRRAFLPLLIFASAVAIAAAQIAPVQVTFGCAVLAMVLFRAIPTRFLYESIDWPVIVLLGAMIPIGEALQTTGATALIAHVIITLTAHFTPLIILGLLFIVTMTLSDFMNNAATAVVMAPIAASIAQAMHASIDPFLMAVAVSASCSFLTPVGHQNNTLVMGPGGYKFIDYIRIGLPLEIIVLIISLPLILWAWPL